MRKRTVLAILAVVAILACLAYTYIPQAKAPIDGFTAWAVASVMPTYQAFATHPIFAPAVAVVSASIGGLISKFVYDGVRSGEQVIATNQIKTLTDDLVQTSGVKSSLETVNNAMQTELTQIKAEFSAFKQTQEQYEALITEKDNMLSNLRGQVESLQRALALKEQTVIEKIAYK